MKKPNFIETQRYLKLLKKGGPETLWTRNLKGQFIAQGGGAGMKFTLPAGLSDKLVIEKGRVTEEELKAVWKDREVWGSKVDAKTHEIVPRKKS